MLADGLIEEVESLRAEGLHTWPPMQSVGYKEVQLYLDGQIKRDELEALIVTSTMQLAKQQMTWFKRDPATQWFDSDHQWKEAVEAGFQLLTPP
jgi:tRNA dimethylallyltransferase